MKYVGGRQVRAEQSLCDLGPGALHDRFLHPRNQRQQQPARDVEDDDDDRRRHDDLPRLAVWQPGGDSRDEG